MNDELKALREEVAALREEVASLRRQMVYVNVGEPGSPAPAHYPLGQGPRMMNVTDAREWFSGLDPSVRNP